MEAMMSSCAGLLPTFEQVLPLPSIALRSPNLTHRLLFILLTSPCVALSKPQYLLEGSALCACGGWSALL